MSAIFIGGCIGVILGHIVFGSKWYRDRIARQYTAEREARFCKMYPPVRDRRPTRVFNSSDWTGL